MRKLFTFSPDKMYHLEIDSSHPNVLSAGSPGRIRRIAEYLDNVEKIVESDRGLVTVHGEYKGLPITAFSTGMGPASVSITLPEVIESCDEDKMNILRLGTAGALQDYIRTGDFLLTDQVKIDENTSEKIMGKGYEAFASADVLLALIKSAHENKAGFQKIYVGITKVTNDIYFDALESHGKDHGSILAVSMEFSVYCALRDRYNRDDPKGRDIKVGNLLVSSNSLVEEKVVDVAEFESHRKQIEEAHIKTGLETLVRLKK